MQMTNQSISNFLSNSSFAAPLLLKLHEVVVIFDTDGKIVQCNHNHFQNNNIQSIFNELDWDRITKYIQENCDEDAPLMEMETELNLSNEKVWYSCKVLCVKTTESNYYILTLDNIEPQKRREENLVKAKEHAESQERIKSSFLANMSHEIRTPMNSIIGFSELVQNSDDEEERQQYLEIIKNCGGYLLNIINDIIDISKIEAGLLDIKIQRTNINELIDELVEIYQVDSRLNSEKVKLVSNNSLEFDAAIILTDRTRIRQILSNLIDNAIKFTKEGSIEVGYELHELDSKKKLPRIRFYVKDSGLGIPASQKELIFHRFHQISESDEVKGSGLGLAIVDALVKKLGGVITLESTLGKGSVFSFSIPYLQRKQALKSNRQLDGTLEKPVLQGKHILIAEDGEANFKYVSALLRGTQAKITWVQNGKESVEAVLSGEHFDLVLMDLRMPIMDGYKASGHIKSIQPKLPIIALTAYAVDGDLEKALEAGCDDYLSKPISVPDFYAKLDFYLIA